MYKGSGSEKFFKLSKAKNYNYENLNGVKQ